MELLLMCRNEAMCQVPMGVQTVITWPNKQHKKHFLFQFLDTTNDFFDTWQLQNTIYKTLRTEYRTNWTGKTESASGPVLFRSFKIVYRFI